MPDLPYFLLAVLGISGLVALNRWSKKSELRAVQKFAKEQGWDLQIVDSYEVHVQAPEDQVTGYRVRYRDSDKTLTEAKLESRGLGSYSIVKTLRIPKKVEAGMFDVRHAMDCRKCGHSIPRNAPQCPYCHAWRTELRIS